MIRTFIIMHLFQFLFRYQCIYFNMNLLLIDSLFYFPIQSIKCPSRLLVLQILQWNHLSSYSKSKFYSPDKWCWKVFWVHVISFAKILLLPRFIMLHWWLMKMKSLAINFLSIASPLVEWATISVIWFDLWLIYFSKKLIYVCRWWKFILMPNFAKSEGKLHFQEFTKTNSPKH